MDIPSLNADYRIGVGSSSAGRTRKIGHIPAVIYHDNVNKMVELDKKDIDSLLAHNGDHAIVNVHLGNDNIKSMIMEIQRHPISNEPVHLDFKPVNDDTRIHTHVPIRFMGMEQVKGSGSILQRQKQELEVECTADHVPKYIAVDVSQMGVGQSFMVRDIEIAEELTLQTKPNEVLATLTAADNYTEPNTQDSVNEVVQNDDNTLEKKE